MVRCRPDCIMAGHLDLSCQRELPISFLRATSRRISGIRFAHNRLLCACDAIEHETMANFTLLNLILALVIIPTSLFAIPVSVRSAGSRVAIRNATLVTLMAYPWDFFAVQQGVWRYPEDPGFLLYGVPLNDSALIWVCTFLSASVFYAISRRQNHSHRHTESEDANQ